MFSKCAHYKNRSPPERKWIICQIPRTHVLETYKGLVYSHYKENVNGNFDHCTKEVWLYYKQKRAVNQKKRLNEITTGKTFSKNTGTQNIFKILLVFVFQKWY